MQSIKVIVLLMLQLMEDLFTFDYDKRKKYIFISMIIIAAGPESLEDHFQKVALLGQMLGNSFFEFSLVSTFQRFSAAF